jgi:hypothetical protein
LFLRSGELLEALVLRNHGDGKVTVQVKNMPITAETRVALGSGEKITVRVEQMIPNIILRMTGEAEIRKIGDLLRLQRSYSGALAELFSGAKESIDPAIIETHAGKAAAKTAWMLLKGLDAAVFSTKTADNPLFVKDMMLGMGLLLERNLLKGIDKRDRVETIREILVRLASAIRDGDSAGRLQSTLAFIEQGVKAVEAQQITVLLGQELDQSLVLQAPCQFPMGIRMQDIFIEQDTEGPDAQKRCRAVLLLSMDALGEVIAEASAYGGRLDCVIYAETPEACDFLTVLLPELRDRLLSAGYNEPSVRCLLERNMREAKSERLADKKLYSLHSVDVHT